MTRTRCALCLAALLALAACGADGPPQYEPPQAPGVSVSGEMRMGVAGRL